MNKTLRQYIGLISAVVAYYVIHEGAHLVYALCTGVFSTIRFVGIVGIQIDIHRDQLSDQGLALFCLAGPIATLVAAWLMAFASKRICQSCCKLMRSVSYYITMILLFLDPIYLSIVYRFVGGGDMNGISLIAPETVVACLFGLLLIINITVFAKLVYPTYYASFKGLQLE